MATTYELLTAALADAQATLKTEKDKYTALTNDGNYAYQKSRLDDPRVKGNPRAWISGSGEFWIGNDAEQGHIAGQAYVTAHEAKLVTQHKIVEDAEAAVKLATEALSKYEKSSPIIGQQIALQQQNAANAAAESKSKFIVTVLIILGVATLVIVSYKVWKNRKGKKSTPAAA